jgi:hypothetical protein
MGGGGGGLALPPAPPAATHQLSGLLLLLLPDQCLHRLLRSQVMSLHLHSLLGSWNSLVSC